MSFHGLIANFSLILNNIALSGCITVYPFTSRRKYNLSIISKAAINIHKHLFIMVICHLFVFFGDMTVKVFVPILTVFLFVFLLLNFICTLYILVKSDLSDVPFANIFSQSVAPGDGARWGQAGRVTVPLACDSQEALPSACPGSQCHPLPGGCRNSIFKQVHVASRLLTRTLRSCSGGRGCLCQLSPTLFLISPISLGASRVSALSNCAGGVGRACLGHGASEWP